MALDNAAREQAIAWAVRTGDPAFDEWDEFIIWLESDPAHAAAYDEIAVRVGDAADALPLVPEPDNDDEPAVMTPSRRPLWIGGAVAAMLAFVAVLGVWQAMDRSYTIETQPGEMRFVDLGSGEQIAIGGATRLVLDRSSRVASLERGQVLFTLHDDFTEPFRVTVGEDTLVDIGTVFEVERTADSMSVAVSEGAVLFNPERQRVRVAPGQILTSIAGSDDYSLVSIPIAQVGEWREGRITFQDASLEDVAAELTRATGVSFAVSPRSAGRQVSGSLLLDPVRGDPRQLGPLLDVNVRYVDGRWEIGAR